MKRKVLITTTLLAAAGTAAFYGWYRVFNTTMYRVPSASMRDTLKEGDMVMVDRTAYRSQMPAPGDIVVFDAPPIALIGTEKAIFVKRCVGAPGNVIEIRGGQLYRDGKAVEETYIREPSMHDFKLVQQGQRYIPVTFSSGGGINADSLGEFRLGFDDKEQIEALRKLPLSQFLRITFWLSATTGITPRTADSGVSSTNPRSSVKQKSRMINPPT